MKEQKKKYQKELLERFGIQLDKKYGTIKITPLLESFLSPIDVCFHESFLKPKNKEEEIIKTMMVFDPFLPSDTYIDNSKKDSIYPSLADAVHGNNNILLRINLNHREKDIIKTFSKLLTAITKDLKRRGKKVNKISNREFDNYLMAYQLREENPKKWTFFKIAQKMFPREFRDPLTLKESAKDPNEESAVKKAERFYKEAKKIIEGS